jgi:TetR/AcrR family transcriptional regulator, transcriptional repressor for nem operon
VARPSKREDIAEAATAHFLAHGYNATGIGDIATAAGAPKGSFYNHFASKQEAALEALDRYAATLPFDVLATPGRSALGRLRTHFELLGRDTIRSDFKLGCMFGNFGAEVAAHSEEIRLALSAGMDQWTEQVQRVLAEAVEAGEVSTEFDVHATALMILSAWEGALIMARVSKSAAPFDAFFTTVFDVLLR